VNGAIVVVLPMLAHRMPAVAAVAAVASGAPREVAENLYRFMVIAAMQEVTAVFDRLDIPPPPLVDGWAGADIWDLKDFRRSQLERRRRHG
jgi:hypothetical protein